MVVFNCNACGEALKKNQVDKHVYRCRGCQVLSCVDCGKDFWGNDYLKHTKCMTEEEKYCGKNYVPKVNKGEVKQEQWIEKVQRAIDQSSSNPSLRGLLENLQDYPNIPRKKQKFQNFLMNSLKVRNPGLITTVWELLMNSSEPEPKTANPSGNEGTRQNQLKETEQSSEKSAVENGDGKLEKGISKMNKRERKEARREKLNKREKKDIVGQVEEDESRTKKGTKRKRDDIGHQENGDPEKVMETAKIKKTARKSKLSDEDATQNESVNRLNGEIDENEEETSPKKKRKFKWDKIIIQVLESKGEISLKKLRKKVLNEFQCQEPVNFNKENLQAKFEKKLKKMPQVKVAKDRVKLK